MGLNLHTPHAPTRPAGTRMHVPVYVRVTPWAEMSCGRAGDDQPAAASVIRPQLDNSGGRTRANSVARGLRSGALYTNYLPAASIEIASAPAGRPHKFVCPASFVARVAGTTPPLNPARSGECSHWRSDNGNILPLVYQARRTVCLFFFFVV